MARAVKRWKGCTPAELRRAAIHKAGHAVAHHRVVGMVCGEASIVPDYKEMCGGCAIAADPLLIYEEWERRSKWRGHYFESILVGRIIGFMAGREAEIIAFGEHHEGDGDDLMQIGLMAEAAGLSMAYLERLRLKVRSLLRRHWHKVEAIVEALLVRKTLSAAEINAIIEKVTTPREHVIVKRIERARKPIKPPPIVPFGGELLEALDKPPAEFIASLKALSAQGTEIAQLPAPVGAKKSGYHQ
jgi:ATP-dependent Zn protease